MEYCDELMDENSEMENSLRSNSDPLSYWKSNQENIPHLTSLAKQYLCALPASIASERLFSTAADIYTDFHNHLSATEVEHLSFLNKNLCTVNFDY